MHDWDDLRIFLAAARSGSLAGAAQRLGVDAATVGRRVARLETSLRSTLFVRSVRGLQLTSAGSRLLDAGVEAEAVMEAAGRADRADLVAGTVRLSVAEGFGSEIIAPALPALRIARPGLRIELAANAGFLSASNREVDMAVTLSAPNAARLVVEPLTDYRLGLYASNAYLERAGIPRDIEALGGFEIVGYVDDLIYAPELRYLDEVLPGLRPTLSSSSIRAQREILLAGGGIGVLPAFMSQGLRQVLTDRIRLTRRFWISTHRDVAETARVRALRAWVKDLVANNQSRLSPGAI
ncbi:MAG TPA: LysR family transcriptional regulator [Phenylobacterium sp.]|nr:LysR family transcriptional regulator [Phenylobacterium sp.]